MSPIIGHRNDELTFKVNFENQTRFLLKLEEPDLNHCSVEFSNECDTVRCSMVSAKLNSTLSSQSAKKQLKLSYEVRPDYICISYWPTLIGFHTLNVTSSGKQISHRLLIQDQPPQTSRLSSSHSSIAHPPKTAFIEINLSQLPELTEFEPHFSRTISQANHQYNHPDDNQNEESSPLSPADELNNLRRLSRVSSELNKITNKYKISSRRTPSSAHSNQSVSSLSTTSIPTFFSSSLTPEKSRLSQATTPDHLAASASANTSANISANISANTSKKRPTLNSTILDPPQSSGESSCYNGTLFETNSCISDSFVLTKFSSIVVQPTDLNNNRLFSSLNRPAGRLQSTQLAGKVLTFESNASDENNLAAVSQRISDQNDLVNDHLANHHLANDKLAAKNRIESENKSENEVNHRCAQQVTSVYDRSIDQLVSRLSDQQVCLQSTADLVYQTADDPIEWPVTGGESESVGDNAVAKREFSSETSLGRLSDNENRQQSVQLDCEANSSRPNYQPNSQTNSQLNGEPNSQPNSQPNCESNCEANCAPNCDQSYGSVGSFDKSLARSDCDLDREFYRMFCGDKSQQPGSRSNSELDLNDKFVFRRNARQQGHYYEKQSTGRLSSQSRLNSQSGVIGAKISNSNLNSKLDRKISKKKRSSLEPLLDKNIDPNRKSVENLFYKLYLNQVHGEELTDLEINRVINKKPGDLSICQVNGEANPAKTAGQQTANHSVSGQENLPDPTPGRPKSDVKLRPSSAAVQPDRPQLKSFSQNLNKNLSKISYSNLSNDVMINSNGKITDHNANCKDRVDAATDKSQSRKKVFSQLPRLDQVKPTEFSGIQGKQFNGQLQRNRSKKKIGKRRMTPLYPDYQGQVSNQVDEIFIILKEEEDLEIVSTTGHQDRSTHLIYDSLGQPPFRRSIDSDSINGLSFNLNNESAINVSTESNVRSSIASTNEPSIHELSSVAESASHSSIDQPTEVVDRSILPVHQMVKHWTQTTNEFNESKTSDSSKNRTTLDIPSCSSIRNKKAIFERTSADNKENEPKKIQLNHHNHSGSSLFALRAKHDVCSRWPDYQRSHSHNGVQSRPPSGSSTQVKDLPHRYNQTNRVQTKLKELNQLANGSTGELPARLANGRASPEKRNNEFRNHFSQPIKSDRHANDRPVGRPKGDSRLKNSSLINGVQPGGRPANGPINGQSNENEQFKVNVKSVKSFWESLSIK